MQKELVKELERVELELLKMRIEPEVGPAWLL